MPGWNDLTRNIQERIFLLVAHETVGFSFPEPPTEDRISALHAVQLSRSNYNPAVKALWQHLWITETDLGDPKHVRLEILSSKRTQSDLITTLTGSSACWCHRAERWTSS